MAHSLSVLLVLRLAVGAVFVAHGAQKLFGLWGGGGLTGTAAFFAQLGLTPAYPLAILVGLVELGGGLLLWAARSRSMASAAADRQHARRGVDGPSARTVSSSTGR